MSRSSSTVFIAEEFKPVFERVGFTPEMIFASPDIKPWRMLPDRNNCVWDLATPGGTVRLHVKRYLAMMPPSSGPREEATGYQLLQSNGIATATVAAWGELADGRCFIATVDLKGFTPADKLIDSGFGFDRLLKSTAAMIADLHGKCLHHRDLYLCHLFARPGAQDVELRLIDAARVRPLPALFTRRRWIVKDLAQFWFSTLALPISNAQRTDWLNAYAEIAKVGDVDGLQRAIVRKSNSIAAHDKRLRLKQPGRNISIPD
ncbi:MAG: hypothetical protein M3O30_14890 [Planctomycetota bacterium]|nr:hypothetical protein [Planctomycetota bacterium]